MSVSLDRLQGRAVFGRGKRQGNAVAHLRAFERLYEQQAQQRQEVVSLMSRAPHDGRPAMVAVPRGVAVNGGETRASETWHSSRHSSSDVTVIAGLPLWVTAALDTETIQRLWPDSVTVLTAQSGSERQSSGKRQQRQASPAESRRAALRAAAGTIRMGEQD